MPEQLKAENVTEAMVEAGVDAYTHGLGVYEIRELLSDVYLAMRALQPRPTPDAAMVERAEAIVQGVEWSMDNCLPAKDETGAECERRRLVEAIAAELEEVRLEALGQHSEGDVEAGKLDASGLLSFIIAIEEGALAEVEDHSPDLISFQRSRIEMLRELYGRVVIKEITSQGEAATPSDRCRELEEVNAALRASLAETRLAACGDWCSDNKHTPECERATALLSKQEGE